MTIKRRVVSIVVLLAAALLPGCRLFFGTAVATGVVHETSTTEAEVLVVAGETAARAAARAVLAEAGASDLAETSNGALAATLDGAPLRVRVRPSEGGAVRITVTFLQDTGPGDETMFRVADLATAIRDRLR